MKSLPQRHVGANKKKNCKYLQHMYVRVRIRFAVRRRRVEFLISLI